MISPRARGTGGRSGAQRTVGCGPGPAGSLNRRLALLVALAGLGASALGAPAWADDAEDPAEVTRPVPRSREVIPYPDDLAFDIEALSCRVRMHVDEQGAVEGLSHDQCLPQLFEHSAAYLRKWKFEPAMREGVPVKGTYRVVITYRLEPDGRPRITGPQFERLMKAHAPLVSDWPGCHMAATVHPDGAVSGLESNDFPACMTLVTLVRPPRKLAAAAAGDVQCTLEATAEHGSAFAVRFIACPEAYRRTARTVMTRWSWNSWVEGGARYRVDLTFAKDPPPS